MSLSQDNLWRLPPRIKVLEALGAIADGRIRVFSDEEAEVISSRGDRKYTVKYRGNAISSTDNGSVYKGYLGYPSIAFLMLKGVLPYDEEIARALKGIPWKDLNEKYKSYAKVMDIVIKAAEERGVSPERLKEFVDEVMKRIKALRLKKLEARQTTLF